MNPDTPHDLDAGIAQRLLSLRQQRGLSLADLAAASGVSKAMISRIERVESSPTAALLGRLAAGLGVPLTDLLVAPEPAPKRLHRRADQALWRDPGQGYHRRQVAPLDPATGVELVEVELPRAAQVAYPPWSGTPYAQRLLLLDGRLAVDYGDEHYELDAGDCLDLAVDRTLAFRALGVRGCRYLLVMAAPR